MFSEITLLFGLLVVIDYFRRYYLTRTFRNIPLTSRIPFIGNFIVLAVAKPINLIETWDNFVQRYGKTFCCVVLGKAVVTTSDHRIVDILLKNTVNLRKNELYNLLQVWLGSGLLLSSGKTWQTMRKIITPTFHFKIMEKFVDIFDRQTDVFIKKLKPSADGQTVVDISKPLSLLTMDIIAESAMGVTINAQMDSKSEFVQAVNTVTEAIAYRFTRPHLQAAPVCQILAPKLYKSQSESIEVMRNFTERIIADKQKSIANSNDTTDDMEDLGIKNRKALLDVLLQSTTEGGKPLSDKNIRDEVNTFMFEGHDTTTSSISLCLYALSRHAEIQQKLYEEIRNHFGDDLSRPVTYADLQQLEYLNCIIKESLRLFPPIPAIGRSLEQDLKLDDCTLLAGTNIVVLLSVMMRDPDIFEDPLMFKPERHLETSSNTSFYSNIPFSAGPRNCVGQRFALFEMKTVIVKVLRHYKLLPMGAEVQLEVAIVLRSSSGVNFGLRPRSYN